MQIDPVGLSLVLLQQMCVYLVVAYLLSRTKIFIPLTHATIRPPHKLACYVIFSLFCIMGTILGMPVIQAIANTPAIGAVLGGLLGGPLVGLAVGITGGLHRYSLGGAFALAAGIDIVVQGMLGGLMHRHLIRKGKARTLFDPVKAGTLTFVGVLLELLIDLAVAKPFDQTLEIVKLIAIPELIANSLGAALFMGILIDRRALIERQSSLFSAKALAIAARADGVLRRGFNQENSMTVARIIYEETGVGAVAITDREKILAFIGIGDDHHLPGTPISSLNTLEAIAHNEVTYADGNEVAYQCSISPTCPLGASLVIPLVGEDSHVIGTIKLYEPKTKLFSTINRTLGEGIAKLLSSQILAGRYEQQKALLAQAEIKLLHAQVNPHFLFNALNTIAAVTCDEPEKARDLIGDLSTFFRMNLKRPNEIASLAEEVEHVNAYLQIERARFSDSLTVDIDIPDSLGRVRLPAFSLQPVVENAIKHGTSQQLRPGHVTISAREDGDALVIDVQDNAGLYEPKPAGQGLGMSLVDRRIRNCFGPSYGVTVASDRDVFTRITIRVPLEAASK
ncbi:histidine kinase [Azospirillum sp. TSH100]|uniref:sensor histidine kinase n=1 Tax=Azospirillum sp. TSH100 TaxID=652764 RepID=UPI000D6083FD|nr:sensor histidine kinase [Azospirillum sp. TSH100]PWC91460.1 histidine kinase [Azospirillum sp. TSH100]QCG89107.1 sensor histidine kinase [Azospirillum sp. TSH100]